MGAGIHGLQYSVISAVAVARLCWTGTALLMSFFCLPSKQMVVLSFSESRSGIMIFIHHHSFVAPFTNLTVLHMVTPGQMQFNM